MPLGFSAFFKYPEEAFILMVDGKDPGSCFIILSAHVHPLGH